MSQATEIYSREFDSIFSELAPGVRRRVREKIRLLGSRLDTFPHERLQGRPEFRLRVGDYRVMYEFDQEHNELFLVTLGHRRGVYRQ